MADGSANGNRGGGAAAPPTDPRSGMAASHRGEGSAAAAKPRVRSRPRPSPPAIASEEPSGSYEVGYGKPPNHTRFKPGQSGNPKGRPKGDKNLKTVLRDELSEVITVRQNGKSKKLSKLEALVKRLYEKALNGDQRAMRELLMLVLRTLPQDDPPEAAAQAIAPDDAVLLEEFLGRYAAAERSRK